MARFFSDEVSIFEQWYIRFLIAAILLAVVFRHKIRFGRILRVSAREKWLVISRGLIGFVLGAGLYAWAAQHAKIGSVAAMQVVPSTAILGAILIREKVSAKKALFIALSFVGALFIVLRNPSDLFDFGIGELASLVSGVLFSLTFVLRKKQTGELNNYELSLATTVVGAVGSYLASLALYRRFVPYTESIDIQLGALFITAGVLSVLMSLLSNYGFEHVKATVASVLLDLELVFGVLFGYLFYRETLSSHELAGVGIILLAIVLISLQDNKETKAKSLL